MYIRLGFLVLLLGLMISPLPGSASAHKFYVSICQIDHNTNTASLEITLKVFTDDLETGVKTRFGTQLLLTSPKEAAEADSLIQAWLEKDFKVRPNKEIMPFEYVGKEVENEVTYIYLEIPGVKTLESISMQNKVLTDIYDEQSNIVHVKTAKGVKSLMLSRNEPYGLLEF